jgi:hypothetical protein
MERAQAAYCTILPQMYALDANREIEYSDARESAAADFFRQTEPPMNHASILLGVLILGQVACNYVTVNEGTSCGPGTTLVGGECVIADTGSEASTTTTTTTTTATSILVDTGAPNATTDAGSDAVDDGNPCNVDAGTLDDWLCPSRPRDAAADAADGDGSCGVDAADGGISACDDWENRK